MIADFRSWGATALALVLSFVPIYIFVAGPEASKSLWLGELSPIELITVAFYLIGAAVAVYAALRNRRLRRWFFIAWAIFCIVFFGEESSWLQAYLQYKTPDSIAQVNAQGEFNLHNLEVVQQDHGDRLKAGLGNLLNPKTLFGSDRLFQYFFLLWFALYPLLCRYGAFARFAANHQLPYQGRRLLLFVWFPLVLCTVLIFLSAGPLVHALNETREMFYALAIAAFLWAAERPLTSRATGVGSVATA